MTILDGVGSGRAGLDSSRVLIAQQLLAAWEEEEAVEALRNRFVTGDWAEGQKRAEAKPGSEAGSEDEEKEEVRARSLA